MTLLTRFLMNGFQIFSGYRFQSPCPSKGFILALVAFSMQLSQASFATTETQFCDNVNRHEYVLGLKSNYIRLLKKQIELLQDGKRANISKTELQKQLKEYECSRFQIEDSEWADFLLTSFLEMQSNTPDFTALRGGREIRSFFLEQSQKLPSEESLFFQNLEILKSTQNTVLKRSVLIAMNAENLKRALFLVPELQNDFEKLQFSESYFNLLFNVLKTPQDFFDYLASRPGFAPPAVENARFVQRFYEVFLQGLRNIDPASISPSLACSVAMSSHRFFVYSVQQKSKILGVNQSFQALKEIFSKTKHLDTSICAGDKESFVTLGFLRERFLEQTQDLPREFRLLFKIPKVLPGFKTKAQQLTTPQRLPENSAKVLQTL